MFFIGLILHISLIFAEEQKTCKGQPIEFTTPESLIQWFADNSNGINDISEALCCMPEEFRQNYKVSPTSVAAQNAHYKSPRLIFGDFEKYGIKFSVNGGDNDLGQAQSIEVMFNNKAKDELEMVDIDFSGSRKHRTHNPDLCMGCHGTDGILGIGGPRIIFDFFPWPRFTGLSMDEGSACEEGIQFSRKLREKTYDEITKNPRFRCLPKPGPANDMGFEFDNSVRKFEPRRLQKIMGSTTDLDGHLPFLAGIASGCFLYEGSPYLPIQWIPSDLRKNYRSEDALGKSVRSSQNTRSLERSVREAHENYIRDFREENQWYKDGLKQLNRGENVFLPHSYGLKRCLTPSETSPNASLKEFRKRTEGMDSTVRRYIYDSAVKAYENHTPLGQGANDFMVHRNGLIRWIFESRGYDISGWDNDLLPNYNASYLSRVSQISALGPKTTLGQLIEKGQFAEGAIKRQVCDELKGMSLNTLSKSQQEPGTHQTESKP